MRSARVVWSSVVLMSAWTGFAFVTTQRPALRRQTPWQDDPYNVVVSLAMFAVPVVLVLVLLRLLVERRVAGGLVRAAGLGAALVLATTVTDLLALALGNRRAEWGDATPWLVGVVAVLAVGSSVALLGARRTTREAPAEPGDWSVVLGRLGPPGRWLDRHALDSSVGVRRHPVAWTVALAEAGAVVAVLGLWLGEGDSLIAVGPLVALVAGSGLAVLVVVANRLLGLVRVSVGRPSLRTLWLGAAVGLEIAFAVHEQLWSALRLPGPGTGLADAYVLMLTGSVLGAVAAYPVAVRRRALTASRGRSRSRR